MQPNPYESPQVSDPPIHGAVPRREPRKAVICIWLVCIAIAFLQGLLGYLYYGLPGLSGSNAAYHWMQRWTFFIYPPLMIIMGLVQIWRELKGLRGFIWQNK